MQSNADRAELGRQMREQFQSDAPDPGMLALQQWEQISSSLGEPDEDLLCDLLTDQLHLATEDGTAVDLTGDADPLINALRTLAESREIDWNAITHRAARHHEEELEEALSEESLL